MTHREEYYTCDRCGAKIENIPRNLKRTHFFYRKSPLNIETNVFIRKNTHAIVKQLIAWK